MLSIDSNFLEFGKEDEYIMKLVKIGQMDSRAYAAYKRIVHLMPENLGIFIQAAL